MGSITKMPSSSQKPAHGCEIQVSTAAAAHGQLPAEQPLVDERACGVDRRVAPRSEALRVVAVDDDVDRWTVRGSAPTAS